MNYKLVKESYRNDGKEAISDFISLCLEEASLYRRGTGFFTSSALKAYANSLINIINNETKVEILCSTKISDPTLINSLSKINDSKAIEDINEMILAAVDFSKDINNRDLQGKILAYLLKSNKLEIKVVVPNFSSDIYHTKYGYFQYESGDKVAFEGSFNESIKGHRDSIEKAVIYRSWADDYEKRRFDEAVIEVDREWNNSARYSETYPLDKDLIEKIVSIAPSKTEINKEIEEYLSSRKTGTSLWKHQEEAVNTFLEKERGILEMATGTGKTTTALAIINQLYEKDLIDTVVIETYGNALLDQWNKELESANLNLAIHREYGSNREANEFIVSPKDSILIIGQDAKKLSNIFTKSSIQNNKSRTLIIHDEVHKFGGKSYIKNLSGVLSQYRYSLGLSATPERDYDDSSEESGNQFIEQEVGTVIYKFGLEEAIEAGILCHFNYLPVHLEFSDEDKQKKVKLIRRYNSPRSDEEPLNEKKFIIELGKIRKKAEFKPRKLNSFLKQHPELLKNSVMFVEDKNHGEEIIEIVRKFTPYFAKFYSENDPNELNHFKKGQVETIIACTRLDEGIDIQSLKNIFLISATSAKISNIQRLGRCLRKDPLNPNKIAHVIDFIVQGNADDVDELNADEKREIWLGELSKYRKK